MSGVADPKTRRAAVVESRRTLRSRGLRPVVIWVPDTQAPGFDAEARRQALVVANSPHEADDQAWVESVSCWPDE